MRVWDPQHPDLWPADSQRQLLHALLGEGDTAVAAWRGWRAKRDPATADHADAALFPSLYLAAERLSVDAGDREVLRHAYMSAWARNECALGLLWDALARFDAAGIPVVVLKGVPLLLFYYEDPGARRMADVDVLIRPNDLVAAATVLQRACWRAVGRIPPPGVARYRHAMEWRHGLGFDLDLHWRPFTPDCPRDAEKRLWERTETWAIEGRLLRSLAAEDLLISMCFHGRKQDRLSRGRWVLDAMRVIERARPPIDWERLADQCVDLGLAPPIHDALAYLHREYAAAVPQEILQRIRAFGNKADTIRYRRLTREALEGRSLTEILVTKWWRYAAVERSEGARPNPWSFVAYYLADRQWEWGLDHKRQVPRQALARMIERLRSHGF